MSLLAGIGAGLSVASGIGSFFGSKKAAKQQERLLEAQLSVFDVDAKYNKEQMFLEKELRLGESKAAIGASNILFSGSAKGFHSELQNVLNKEIAHQRMSDDLQRKVIKLGGEAQVKATKQAGISSLLGAATSAVSFGLG